MQAKFETITDVEVLEPFGPIDPLTIRVRFSNGYAKTIQLKDASGLFTGEDALYMLLMATGLGYMENTDELIGRSVHPHYFTKAAPFDTEGEKEKTGLMPEGVYSGTIIGANPPRSGKTGEHWYFQWIIKIEGWEHPGIAPMGGFNAVYFLYQNRDRFIGMDVQVRVKQVRGINHKLINVFDIL